jgi:hypothetical protein
MHRNIAPETKPWADHLHDAAGHTQLVEDEEAQRHEAHVRDRRIGDELLHVLLYQRHQAHVDDGDQAQGDDEGRPFAAGIGQ